MIEQKRLNHIIGVARLMKEKAIYWGLDEQEMFSLGLLHDIGYEFGDVQNHPYLGGELLSKQGYKYYQEILNHGNPDSAYQSKALDLLNYADLHIDGNGNYVTMSNRLEDIKSRYGEDSIYYQNPKKVAAMLINKLPENLKENI